MSIMNPKDKKASHIPFRLNLLFVIVFLSFSILIIRLSYLQIVKGSEFDALVKRTETTTTSLSVPRGLIYDSLGNVLVGNQAKKSITYTRLTDQSPSEMIDIAKQLSKFVTIDTDNVTERDRKDFWAASNPDELAKRTPKSAKSLTGGDLYEKQLETIKEEDIGYGGTDLIAVAIFKKMNQASALATVTLKNDGVTEEEVAVVNEHLAQMSGISVATDWDREYPQDDLLRSIFGKVTNEQTGLPEDRVKELLSKGYSLNDRIGSSYLEKQYEDVLAGTKRQVKSTTNTANEVVTTEEVYEGKKGDNLLLTINSDFQRQVEQIATNALKELKSPLADRVYITAMNPKNGDVYAMVGKKKGFEDGRLTNEITDDALGNANTSYGMGSAIKAATVLAGYMDNVITLDDNTMVDEPLQFQGSQPKSSIFNRNGSIELNDLTALERSSNVYMMKLAMRMGGQNTYKKGGTLNIDPVVFDKLRGYYAQFGLGVRTGIDLPNESVGYQGQSRETFYALDFAYGQYDLYTPLQLTQYMATIANDGVRVSPRLVKAIRGTSEDGGLGGIQTAIQPNMMNHIGATQDQIERVQAGLHLVTHGSQGTARGDFSNFNHDVAGKTGTAEAFYDGPLEEHKGDSVINSTFVGYAPYDDPEFVISVVIPYQSEDTSIETLAQSVAYEVFDLYYNKDWTEKTDNSETDTNTNE